MKSKARIAGVAVCCVTALSLAAETNAQQWEIKQDVDPRKVVGHQQCAECHASEVAAWEKSHHATASFKLLEGADAKTIAGKLSIADATKDRRCTTCHETQKTNGRLKVISCESCHSHAGPPGNGWLELHGALISEVKNPPWKDRGQESDDAAKARLAKCDGLGMRRPENIYALAKNCFECHNVGSEVLVDIGGHPAGKKGAAGIEFLKWSSGEVRHNFQENPRRNTEVSSVWLESRLKGNQKRSVKGRKRVMFVVGQLADLEVSLRNRAQAKQKGAFFEAANARIERTADNLKDIVRAARIQELQAPLAALKKMKLANLTPGDEQACTALANQVQAIGTDLAKENGDARGWSRLDRMLPRDSMGRVPR